jgi:uncharacterized protein
MNVTTESLRRILAPVLARYPAVRAVYLFGSQADASATEASDIDLGIVGSAADLRAERLALLADLVREGFDRVDLVLLDDADPVLRFEAVHRNCLLFARPDFDHGAYVSRVLREYFDLEPYLEIQRKAFKARLLGG